jgi:anti-anti-sigma factor
MRCVHQRWLRSRPVRVLGVFRHIKEQVGEGWYMTAIHIDIDDASPPRSVSTFFDCRRARVRAKTDTGFTVISISGEIDASNADELSHRVRELASDCGALIVDLAEVDFIALDGLRALFALNIECARTGTTWALIASPAVNRLLRVGDHDKLLPAMGSATEALLLVRRSGRSRRSLQLVSPAG